LPNLQCRQPRRRGFPISIPTTDPPLGTQIKGRRGTQWGAPVAQVRSVSAASPRSPKLEAAVLRLLQPRNRTDAMSRNSSLGRRDFGSIRPSRSNGRAPGRTNSARCCSNCRGTRSKLVERTGVQGFHLVTLSSASPDKAVVLRASNKWFEGFTLLLGRPIRLTSALNCISDVVRGRRYFSEGPVADSCGAIWLSIHAFRRSCD
jgi:hypothetical protein